MDHRGCHAVLVVRAHHHAQEENHECGHRVEGDVLRVRSFPRGVGVSANSITGWLGEDGSIKRVFDALAFEEHSALINISTVLSIRWKIEVLTRPPPKNKMVIETCSRSMGDHSLPQPERCSRNTLVEPYRKITKDSVNSPEGTLAFHLPTMSRVGLIFQAHPRSAQQPSHRPKVNTPYQKKIPPLMKCASPLKIS